MSLLLETGGDSCINHKKHYTMKKTVVFDHTNRSMSEALGIEELTDKMIDEKMDALIDYYNEDAVSKSQFLEKLIRTVKGVVEGPETEEEGVTETEATLAFFAMRIGELAGLGKSQSRSSSIGGLMALMGGVPPEIQAALDVRLRRKG